MSSSINATVKLAKEGILTCTKTGWSIVKGQTKKTPGVFSQQISEWIKQGSLVVVADGEDPHAKYRGVLDVVISGFGREALAKHCEEINKAVGTLVIDPVEKDKKTLYDAIMAWRESVLKPAAKPAAEKK